jgi:hypothetical protein
MAPYYTVCTYAVMKLYYICIFTRNYKIEILPIFKAENYSRTCYSCAHFDKKKSAR